MRAMLFAGDGAGVADLVTGSGISQLQEPVPDVLFAAIHDWVAEHGKLDLLLAGMVGSNIGWRAAPYVPCPAELGELANRLVTFEECGHSVAIVPGLSCTNILGQPDMMRGEELQILGWLRSKRPTSKDAYLLCLPGTHTKWVRVADGAIETFTTSLTGEVYALLKQQSVLLPRDGSPETAEFDADSFRQGLRVATGDGASLLHSLFSTRGRQLAGGSDNVEPSSYLSGLLIGSDVAAANRSSLGSAGPVELIGDPALCEKFELALLESGREANVMDGTKAVSAGFQALATGVSK